MRYTNGVLACLLMIMSKVSQGIAKLMGSFIDSEQSLDRDYVDKIVVAHREGELSRVEILMCVLRDFVMRIMESSDLRKMDLIGKLELNELIRFRDCYDTILNGSLEAFRSGFDSCHELISGGLESADLKKFAEAQRQLAEVAIEIRDLLQCREDEFRKFVDEMNDPCKCRAVNIHCQTEKVVELRFDVAGGRPATKLYLRALIAAQYWQLYFANKRGNDIVRKLQE